MLNPPNQNKECLYYPIGFKVLNPDDHHVVPIRVDGGMYYLRAPYKISQDIKNIRTIAMGIALKIPECFEVFTNKPGITIPMIIHAHIDSLYDVMTQKGIEILTPKVLSPSYYSGELKLTLRNIGTKIANIEPGEPIACIYFTATPPILLGENNNI